VKHDGDVVYWVVKFPFPFSNREYVFKYFPAVSVYNLVHEKHCSRRFARSRSEFSNTLE